MLQNVITDGASKKCAAGILNHCVDINQLVLKRDKCVAGFSDICLQSAHQPLGAGPCNRKEQSGAACGQTAVGGESDSARCDCGLGVQRDTGRLRWCAGNRWSRLLIVIPAALLPLLGLFVLLTSLGAVGAADVSVSRVRPRSSMTRRDSCTAVHYGLGEHLEAEEREVLSDLRTSFIPPESVIVPPNCVGGRRSSRSKRRSCSEEHCDNSVRRTRFLGNVSSDITIWANTSYGDDPILRLHKVSNFTLESDEPVENFDKRKVYSEYSKEKHVDSPREVESSGDGELNVKTSLEEKASEIGLPWKITSFGKDSGTITDDESGQNRNLDMEEAELSEPATNHQSAVHDFWKGQGSKESIRNAQAEAMKLYIDPTADPCKDFYQHACGNWERINPIPADKAGYDTFEMLRESLDSVLKELLTRQPDNTSDTLMEDTYSTAEISTQQPSHVVRRNHKFHEKHGHHKHHRRHHHKNKEKAEKSGDVGSNHEDKLDRSRRSLINMLRKYRKPAIPENLKVAPSILNLRQIRLLRRVRSMLTDNRRFHKRRKYKRNKVKIASDGETSATVKNMLLVERSAAKFKENSTESNFKHKKRTQDDYNYIDYDDDDEDNGGSTVSTANPDIEITTCASSTTETYAEVGTTNTLDTSSENTLNPNDNDAITKAIDLYESCMNYEVLEKRGNAPLVNLLDDLGGWPAINPDWNEESFDWLHLIAQLRLYNNDVLIAEWVGPDIKNSDEYVVQFDQTSLGLPTRDYFLQSSNLQYLNAYREYMITVITLMGADPINATFIAAEIINFETKLAKITTAPEERRNVSVLYQRLTLGRLRQIIPQIDWMRYLHIVLDRPVNATDTVVMFALGYMQDLVTLLGKTDSRTIANYLMWRFARHRVNNLDDRYQPAKQKFYFVLFGREQSPPRWKNCVSQVNANMGMALGALFVKKYFDENSKKDTTTMTSDIQQSFRELLNTTDWIDNETKHLASLKVDAMLLRIGYPDYILDQQALNDKYKDVTINKDKYFENTLDILQHLTRTEQSRLGQLVNKTMWNTAPAVVNAYYSRNKNQIMFPAGILQPPFYHRYFPRSLNYGGIGVVIGHELTHGFDDKGRLFDRDGNLHRWWNDQSIAGFHERAQCLIDQYGNYTVKEVNMQIDGINTQGENIADNGGIKQAFRAYERWLEDHGNVGETLPGINATSTQLFFLNFAQVWCGAMRPEAIKNKLKTAVHSPGKFRVIGTLSNSEDFAREYHCPLGSPMNPVRKCSVW